MEIPLRAVILTHEPYDAVGDVTFREFEHRTRLDRILPQGDWGSCLIRSCACRIVATWI